jgi:predicted nuclease of predicted toxin-antitoxin system
VKVLLDTCVWGPAADVLRGHSHDVIWAGDWDRDPGDEEILRTGHAEGRVLVTLDKDFGELAILRRQPHSGIVRLVGLASREQGPACHQVLQHYGEELQEGAIATVEPHRVRVRSPEPGEE